MTSETTPINEIIKSIDGLIGDNEFSGDNPFALALHDKSTNQLYRYELRKGDDWLTIQQQENCTGLIRTFQFQRSGDTWEYIDPYMIKYNEPSTDLLETAYQRLKIAIELSKPKQITDDANTAKVLPEH